MWTTFLWVYEHTDKKQDQQSPATESCPPGHTDSGREFMLKTFMNRWGVQRKAAHGFDQLCQEQGIEHWTTQPYTPKTNGLVERMNRLTNLGDDSGDDSGDGSRGKIEWED